MWRSSRRRDQLIETSCVHNLDVRICTVVHTTAKTITITTVAHVRPNASCTAVKGTTAAAAAVHVVFSSPSMTSRLIRCPRSRRLLLAVKILVPAAVVRQAAIARTIVVRLVMVSTAPGLVSRSHAYGTGRVSRVVALLLLLLVVMMRLWMIAIMLLLRLIMLIVWHNRWVLVISFSTVSQQRGVFTTATSTARLLLIVRLWLLLLRRLGLLLLLNCLLLVVVWLWVRYSMTWLTFVGPGTCNAVLTCHIGSSSATRVGTTGTMLVATGRYRGVGQSLAADIAPVRSANAALHAESPVLLLSSSGERYLRSQAIARNERAQVVVVLGRWWSSWPRLH